MEIVEVCPILFLDKNQQKLIEQFVYFSDNNRHGNTIFAKIIGESGKCAVINGTEDGIREGEIGFECRKAWDFHEGMPKKHFR